MGQAALPKVRSMENFKIILGHSDRLVGLSAMLDLLVELGFDSRHVEVVLGDHYFFSVGRQSIGLHKQSREVAFGEIVEMVRVCRR